MTLLLTTGLLRHNEGAMQVVISGTSSGIGLAIARKFLAEGHAVYGFDVNDAALEHPAYTHIKHDICSDLPHEVLNTLDPEVVVHNAGTQEDAGALAVNLEGTIRFNEYFIDNPSLKAILFVASASARNGSEFPRYVASKAGIVGYMKNTALKLAPRGVVVNSVSPGGVITPANQHILDNEELYTAVKNETLTGKWATSEEIAELVYFLTVVNRSIIGEDILIDNGEMLKSNFIW